MDPEAIDWRALERLRRLFLAGTAGAEDYWRSEHDLASYDATFAQRIGWKWDFVLSDLRQMNWAPPTGEVLDWGCGSGIAARAFVDHFGEAAITGLRFVDRSPLAMRFAASRARARFSQVPVATGGPLGGGSTVILISHVLTELTPDRIEALLPSLQGAQAVLWVEPGTYEASLALIAIRERLRQDFHPVAPCGHPARCGILSPGNETHWCHHFASPPPEVFTDPFWGRFAHLLEVDLRSVPLSYLVLDRRPPPPLDSDTVRVLGRPRLNKADVRVIACDPTGVREHLLTRRAYPDVWKAARKERLESRQVWKPLSEGS